MSNSVSAFCVCVGGDDHDERKRNADKQYNLDAFGMVIGSTGIRRTKKKKLERRKKI